MFGTSGSHGYGLDLSFGDQLIELAPAYAEVMWNLLRAEPLGAIRLCDLGLGGVGHTPRRILIAPGGRDKQTAQH